MNYISSFFEFKTLVEIVQLSVFNNLHCYERVRRYIEISITIIIIIQRIILHYYPKAIKNKKSRSGQVEYNILDVFTP